MIDKICDALVKCAMRYYQTSNFPEILILTAKCFPVLTRAGRFLKEPAKPKIKVLFFKVIICGEIKFD